MKTASEPNMGSAARTDRRAARRASWSHGASGRVPYEYPEHLRTLVADLPAAPGVYVFYGATSDLPLYIGKSIHVRNRVLAHLRTPTEAALLRQTQRISVQRTAGEIGALLLESALIKAQQPLYNQKLRRSRRLCAWQWGEGEPPTLVDARSVDFAADHGAQPLWGLFQSRAAAQQWLQGLAKEHGLCRVRMGLEPSVAQRSCFGFQIRQCRGVCCGQESTVTHDARCRFALQSAQVRAWPRASALALVENEGPWQQVHVVRNWCHLGTVATLEQARELTHVTAQFDADAYKILLRPVLAALMQTSANPQAIWLN